MLQAKVIGNVTSIKKHDSLIGQKLLLVVPVSPDGKPDGDPSIVFDRLGAGPGDLVLISSDGLYTGSELIGTRATPARWGVIGIIDRKPDSEKTPECQAGEDVLENAGDAETATITEIEAVEDGGDGKAAELELEIEEVKAEEANDAVGKVEVHAKPKAETIIAKTIVTEGLPQTGGESELGSSNEKLSATGSDVTHAEPCETFSETEGAGEQVEADKREARFGQPDGTIDSIHQAETPKISTKVMEIPGIAGKGLAAIPEEEEGNEEEIPEGNGEMPNGDNSVIFGQRNTKGGSEGSKEVSEDDRADVFEAFYNTRESLKGLKFLESISFIQTIQNQNPGSANFKPNAPNKYVTVSGQGNPEVEEPESERLKKSLEEIEMLQKKLDETIGQDQGDSDDKEQGSDKAGQ